MSRKEAMRLRAMRLRAMRVDATALNFGNKTKSRKMFAGGEMWTVCQATGLVNHACFMTICMTIFIHLFRLMELKTAA